MAKLPTWEEVGKKVRSDEPTTELEKFIYGWEPTDDAEDFRTELTAVINEQVEQAAKVPEAMRPTGGRMWTDEQSACFEALTVCADNIRKARLED